mgnify:CR=1 FL=1
MNNIINKDYLVSSLGMNVFNTGGDHNTGNANIFAYIIKGDESW